MININFRLYIITIIIFFNKINFIKKRFFLVLICLILQLNSMLYFRLLLTIKTSIMSVLKVIEILGNSNISFEDAAQNVINEVAKTVKNIKSVYIKDMQVTVKNNKITEYRVNTKVSFGILEE